MVGQGANLTTEDTEEHRGNSWIPLGFSVSSVVGILAICYYSMVEPMGW
jgi:hypothetical protein